MAKQWQTVQIPFVAGLDTKGDARASSPPLFDLLRDAEFEEPGGLQTRKPFAALSMSIFGGGTISGVRKLAVNGDELLLFTSTALYSWNAQLSKWVLKDTYLAVEINEEPRFVTPAEQTSNDRAELSGTIVFSWQDGTKAYLAAIDKTTGSVLMAPTAIAGTASNLRVVALTTKILAVFSDTIGGFYCYALDPAAPATALAGASTTVYNTGSAGSDICDVIKTPGADSAVFVGRLTPTTSYVIAKITAGLSVTTSVKARTCTGPIAVSVTPDGVSAQVVRANGTAIVGDLITVSSLADVYTGQALDTTGVEVDFIAAQHRSTTDGGYYRCYAFWSTDEDTFGIPNGGTRYNWVDNNNSLGTAAVFGVSTADVQLGVASRAFDYNGHVYLWMWSAGWFESGASSLVQIQNTYFLYRDDHLLCGKAVASRGGGSPRARGHLPGVAAVSGSTGFAWCGTERRIISLAATSTGYSARSPRDITFEFDSNAARQTQRLGRSLYITGGEIQVYDTLRIVELGFHFYPFYFSGTPTGGGGSLADGDYAYKHTYRWDNAVGEIDRSTTATIATLTMTGGPRRMAISASPIAATHKYITGALPAFEFWRTVASPTSEAPFYLVTSKDPSSTGNNQYYDASETSFFDGFSDATLQTKEPNPENGGALENIAPPAARIIYATDDRLFLAGVAGDPDRVWYSKLRAEGELAAFHEALTISIPHAGGDITALAVLNETLVVFRERAVYVVPGQGFDNLGGGQNYGPASRILGDVGASSGSSVALSPIGLVFKSAKGFYVVSPQWSCQYIGGPVSSFDSEDVVSSVVVESQHQIRFMTESRILVLDYLINQWAEWTIVNGVDAVIWNSTYVYIDSDTDMVMQQATTYSGVAYGLDAETAWIKLNDLQGAGSVRWLSVIGEYRGAHKLRIRLARDYQQDGSGNWVYYDDDAWTPSPTTVGSVEQVRVGPSIPKCQAIKVRITAVDTDGVSAPTTEACKLTGLALEVGVDPGINRRLPSAQKT